LKWIEQEQEIDNLGGKEMAYRLSLVALAAASLADLTTAQTNFISTYAGGGPNGTPLCNNVAAPWGVAIASNGDIYFSASEGAAVNWGAVYKLSGDAMTLVAGTPGAAGYSGDDGPATSANLFPYGVALDGSGNLYIAAHDRIRKVAANTGVITTVAGNGSSGYSGDGGPATSATLNQAAGVAVDNSGNLYIADSGNNRIRKVAVGTGVITTMAGNGAAGSSGDGGLATSATLSFPNDVVVDSNGNLYIADTGNSRIRKVAAGTGVITTVAGGNGDAYRGDGGLATSASLFEPFGVTVDSIGNVYIADTRNARIRKVAAGTGIITTVAGNPAGSSGDGGPAVAAMLGDPHGLAVDSSGDLYLTDNANNRIRKVVIGTGVITTVAGNGTFSYSGDGGPATSVSLDSPSGVAVDGSGNVYIADLFNSSIRKVAAGTGIITTFVGEAIGVGSCSNGPTISATLDLPDDVAVDSSGNIYSRYQQ
jgi:sugar lactone lactonase YvrE